jgi:soluble lytic murein transglycosylase-like protein
MTAAMRVAPRVVLGLCLLAGPAAAQTLRVEDERGTIHYTNSPCAPLYQRLAPGACPPPPAAPGTPETAAPDPAVAPPYAREIESTATRYGVDRRLVEAVVQVESGGNPQAVSPRGALGLMQLMPARAAALGVRDVFDPRANLDGGVRHLRALLTRYAGNLTLALAAYNAGEEAVRLHGGVPPYSETREYVRKILALYAPAAGVSTPQPAKPPRRPAARQL